MTFLRSIEGSSWGNNSPQFNVETCMWKRVFRGEGQEVTKTREPGWIKVFFYHRWRSVKPTGWFFLCQPRERIAVRVPMAVMRKAQSKGEWIGSGSPVRSTWIQISAPVLSSCTNSGKWLTFYRPSNGESNSTSLTVIAPYFCHTRMLSAKKWDS